MKNNYRQILTELFDKPAKIKWSKDKEGSHYGHAKMKDGSKAKFEFHRNGDNSYHHTFTVNDTARRTGKGNQHEVMSTAKHAVSHFLKKHKPKAVSFTADKTKKEGGGRSKLYDHMIKRHAKDHDYDHHHGDLETMKVHVLKKKA